MDPLIGQMRAGEGMKLIDQVCNVSLVATGHSMGGGLAQLFAALANQRNDTAGLNLTVSHLFGFGPTPVALAPLENGMDVSREFQGGLFFNVKDLPNLTA